MDKAQQIDALLRSMGVLKQQLSTEIRKLNQGRGSNADVNELYQLLRSDGEQLEQLLAKRREQLDDTELAFDLHTDEEELLEHYRCYVCDEPVTAALWEPDPKMIRCLMCRDDH